MPMNVRAVLFSSLNETTLSRLTTDRTVGAIPFGGRYRLVDFALSALVHAGIYRITLAANYNYASLADHIGSGKDWDLDRYEGGIRFLFPYQMKNSEREGMYFGRMEALLQLKEEMTGWQEDNVILMDTDLVATPDMAELLRFHIREDADVTFLTAPADPDGFTKHPRLMIHSENGTITGMEMSHRFSENAPEVSLGTFVVKTEYLRRLTERAATHGNPGLLRLLAQRAGTCRFSAYRYAGYAGILSSFGEYYRVSMDLAQRPEVAEELLWKRGFPLQTRTYNSVPTRYGEYADVRDCVVADGCEIGGSVRGSVLFRGVRIAPDAIVENCVLMDGCTVESGARLSCIVADEGVRVREGVSLSGHASMPFYIQRGRTVS